MAREIDMDGVLNYDDLMMVPQFFVAVGKDGIETLVKHFYEYDFVLNMKDSDTDVADRLFAVFEAELKKVDDMKAMQHELGNLRLLSRHVVNRFRAGDERTLFTWNKS